MADLLFKDESFKIVGRCMEVYNTLGSGFLEGVYQDAMELEFIKNAIPHARERKITITYKGNLLKHHYVADFVCHKEIIVEVKAIKTLMPEHQAQTLNYLRATNSKLGLLINYGNPDKLEHMRLVNSKTY